jgi:DNA-binding response OmpR family regulator
MRKPRIIICDDEVMITTMIRTFLAVRKYDILTYPDPTFCPIYASHADQCTNKNQCADVLITDLQMPVMSGIELLLRQSLNGCKLDNRNKAVMTHYMDEDNKKITEELGCAYFEKPFKLSELADWLDDCESRFDLTQPLDPTERRKESRKTSYVNLEFSVNISDRLFPGTAVNISDCGLCLWAKYQFRAEQNIRLHTELPNSCHKATVRWSKPLKDNLFLTGVHCC